MSIRHDLNGCRACCWQVPAGERDRRRRERMAGHELRGGGRTGFPKPHLVQRTCWLCGVWISQPRWHSTVVEAPRAGLTMVVPVCPVCNGRLGDWFSLPRERDSRGRFLPRGERPNRKWAWRFPPVGAVGPGREGFTTQR